MSDTRTPSAIEHCTWFPQVLGLFYPHQFVYRYSKVMEFCVTLRKKVTIHQVTAMLATSKNVLFPGHNHLLTTGTDDPRAIIKVSGHQYQWLASGYDLEIGHFQK